MKTCPNCGALMEDSRKFCTNCGTALAGSAAGAQASAPAPGPAVEPPQQYANPQYATPQYAGEAEPAQPHSQAYQHGQAQSQQGYQQPYQAQPQQPYGYQQPYQPQQPYGYQQAPAQTERKAMAIFAYFGLVGWIIAYFATKNERRSSYLLTHLNSGGLLAAVGIILGFLGGIFDQGFLSSLIGILTFAVSVDKIIGIVYAAQGKDKPAPLTDSVKLIQ